MKLGVSKSDDWCCVFEIQHFFFFFYIRAQWLGICWGVVIAFPSVWSTSSCPWGRPVCFSRCSLTNLTTHSRRSKTVNVKKGRACAAIANINRWGDVRHVVCGAGFSLEDNCFCFGTIPDYGWQSSENKHKSKEIFIKMFSRRLPHKL